MAVVGVAETVDVPGSTPVIETSRTQVSSTINETAVQNLPVNGRNFIDFALLTPGVTRDVRTGDISFAGQRGTLNSLVVDGADNNNTFFGQTLGRTGSGRAPYQFSQDAVQEFQVNSNAYSAEYGRAGGAVINVVTKSGTNELQRLGVRVLPRQGAQRQQRDQRAATTGRSRRITTTSSAARSAGRSAATATSSSSTTTASGTRSRTSSSSTLPAQRAARRRDTQAGLARLQPLGRRAGTAAQNQDVFLVKTDHQLTGAHRLSLRYNHQNFTGRNFENGGPQNALEHTGDSNGAHAHVQRHAAPACSAAALFNEVRVQCARDQEPGLANSANPEAIVRQGGATVLTHRPQQLQPARDDDQALADRRHAHLGARRAQARRAASTSSSTTSSTSSPASSAARTRSAAWPSFASGRAERRRRVLPAELRRRRHDAAPRRNPNIREYSFFVQDEWRLRARPHASTPACATTCMKIAQPPVRNPDAQLAAAGIDTSRARRRHQQLGPAPRRRLEPGRPAVRRARRLRPLLRPHAVDHARHRALEQRHQRR